MKKSFAFFAVALLLLASLCGCNSQKKYEPADGNWELQTYAIDGVDTDISECEYPRISMSIDGRVAFINGENSYEGTYDIDDNDITAELNGNEITMKLTNNSTYVTVTYTSDEKELMMVYKKVA